MTVRLFRLLISVCNLRGHILFDYIYCLKDHDPLAYSNCSLSNALGSGLSSSKSQSFPGTSDHPINEERWEYDRGKIYGYDIS